MSAEIRDDGYLADSPPCTPFTEAVGRPKPRYDMGPVLEQCGPVSMREIERKLNLCYRDLVQFMRSGIPFWTADDIATRLYRTPGELWPEWDRGEPSPVITDWYERRRRGRVEQDEQRTAEAARQAAVRAALPALDFDDIHAPGEFRLMPKSPPRTGPPPPQAGVSDDLVHIFPAWLADSPNPPGLPPRKEEASCWCSTLDSLGRPVFIGRCGAHCERRTS